MINFKATLFKSKEAGRWILHSAQSLPNKTAQIQTNCPKTTVTQSNLPISLQIKANIKNNSLQPHFPPFQLLKHQQNCIIKCPKLWNFPCNLSSNERYEKSITRRSKNLTLTQKASGELQHSQQRKHPHPAKCEQSPFIISNGSPCA